MEADDIWLWFNQILAEDKKDEISAGEKSVIAAHEYLYGKKQPLGLIDAKDVLPYPAWFALPQARQIIFDLLRAVEGTQLGRVIITRLKPGKQIIPHVDAGAPAEFFKRYQVALQSLPGAIFQIEDEKVNFNTGEIWLINNRAEHSVQNNSKDDRIVMIVDIRAG